MKLLASAVVSLLLIGFAVSAYGQSVWDGVIETGIYGGLVGGFLMASVYVVKFIMGLFQDSENNVSMPESKKEKEKEKGKEKEFSKIISEIEQIERWTSKIKPFSAFHETYGAVIGILGIALFFLLVLSVEYAPEVFGESGWTLPLIIMGVGSFYFLLFGFLEQTHYSFKVRLKELHDKL